ncbi:MAG: hypothetical protein R2716_07945 [Microthrixaceae bacterium]
MATSRGEAPVGWAAPGSATTFGPERRESGGDVDPGTPLLRASSGVAVARGDAPWPRAGHEPMDDHGALSGLEPVGVGGVLDGGFEFLRRHFALLVGFSAALYLPLQLADLWISISAGLSAEIEGSPLVVALGSAGGSLPLSWAVVGLRVVALSAVGMAAGVVVGDSLARTGRRPAEVMKLVARRWWVALLVPLVCIPVKAAFACFAYVGFFIGDSLLMCASVAAGAERTGPLASFARSWRLGVRSFGTALGVSLGAFAISVVLQFALYLGPALLTSVIVPSEEVLLAVQQVAMLSLIVTQPLTAAITARAYVELRCRSEALDLSLRREALGLTP